MNDTLNSAEVIGVQCLSWLAGNDDLLPVFLGATGTSTTDIRDRARDPEFLIFVLDFIMMDNSWVIAFCDQAGLPYDSLMQARAALPGGEQVHWT